MRNLCRADRRTLIHPAGERLGDPPNVVVENLELPLGGVGEPYSTGKSVQCQALLSDQLRQRSPHDPQDYL